MSPSHHFKELAPPRYITPSFYLRARLFRIIISWAAPCTDPCAAKELLRYA